MRMVIKRKEKGFTLAELLIVVAIIAVLVSVSIPIFRGQAKRARSTTCEANRRSVKAVVTTKLIDSDGAVADGFCQLTNEQKKEFTCPDGGVITYKVDKENNAVSVYCSVHAKANSLGDQASMDKMMADLASLGTIDSTATEGNNPAYKQALEKFKEAGISLDGVKAWRYDRGFLYFSMEDIPQDKATSMYMIQYNSTSHNYTVWVSNTKQHTSNNDPTKPYYIFGGTSGKPLNSNVADQTYEKALETYQKALENQQ